MIITTTNTIEGKRIVEYKGLVFGEVVSGVNFIKDFFAGWTDTLGGRSSTYESEAQDARDDAVKEMAKRAEKMGANAIIGVELDYQIVGEKNGMIMFNVIGTAVRVED